MAMSTYYGGGVSSNYASTSYPTWGTQPNYAYGSEGSGYVQTTTTGTPSYPQYLQSDRLYDYVNEQKKEMDLMKAELSMVKARKLVQPKSEGKSEQELKDLIAYYYSR